MAQEVDAAKDLMKQNKCTQCHGMDKDKDGPSFKKTAAKYKGKADAEATLVKHLTSSPKVKLADGSEEEHKVVKTTPPNDKAQESRKAVCRKAVCRALGLSDTVAFL